MGETRSTILNRTKIFDSMSVKTGIHRDAHMIKIVQNSNKLTADATPDNAVIEGFLREPLNFDLSAKWEQKEGIVSNLLSSELANTILQPAEKLGFGAQHAGYVTKKYYTGGTDITFNINMRVLDVNGENNVLLSVATLTAFMLPKQQGKDISIGGMFPQAKAAAQASAKKIEEEHATGVGFGPSLARMGVVSGGINEVVDAGIILTQSPTPVSIFVGEFMQHSDMVITTINFTFSKELVEIKQITEPSASDDPSSAERDEQVFSAPLYVDVNLTVTSRTNLYLTKGKNSAKGTHIKDMVWGYDARTALSNQKESQTTATEGR